MCVGVCKGGWEEYEGVRACMSVCMCVCVYVCSACVCVGEWGWE